MPGRERGPSISLGGAAGRARRPSPRRIASMMSIRRKSLPPRDCMRRGAVPSQPPPAARPKMSQSQRRGWWREKRPGVRWRLLRACDNNVPESQANRLIDLCRRCWRRSNEASLDRDRRRGRDSCARHDGNGAGPAAPGRSARSPAGTAGPERTARARRGAPGGERHTGFSGYASADPGRRRGAGACAPAAARSRHVAAPAAARSRRTARDGKCRAAAPAYTSTAARRGDNRGGTHTGNVGARTRGAAAAPNRQRHAEWTAGRIHGKPIQSAGVRANALWRRNADAVLCLGEPALSVARLPAPMSDPL